MTAARFLDCAYTLLVDARVGLGMDFMSAVEKTNESLGLAPNAEAVASVRVPTPEENTRALAQLTAMMGGMK